MHYNEALGWKPLTLKKILVPKDFFTLCAVPTMNPWNFPYPLIKIELKRYGFWDGQLSSNTWGVFYEPSLKTRPLKLWE